MCGFLISSNTRIISDNVFKLALENLHHRGPDQTNIHNTTNITFGFKRLSIQDLTDLGSQPMIDEKGNVLCFNGEIYNFKELKEILINKRIRFKSNSDTEVLLKTINYYGLEKALELIDGMFSFVFFDVKQNKIYACTDLFGMKPLYYYISGNNFIFASEIKAILPLLRDCKININNSLNPIFFTNLNSNNKTMFDDIFSLDAGQIMSHEINSTKFNIKEYSNLCSFVDEKEYLLNSKLNSRDISNKVSETLNNAVNTHLISDANTGILFSAGLDSSIIASKAFNHTKRSLSLFKYQSADLNDSNLANEFVEKIKSKIFVTKNIDENLIFNLPHLIYAYETLNNSDGSPLYAVCENAKKLNFKVLLTGDCADELFGGYGSFDNYRLNQFIKNNFKINWLINLTNKVFPGLRSLFIESMHHMISPFDDRFINPYLDFSLYRGTKNLEWNKCKEAYSFLNNNHHINCNAFLLDEVKNRMKRFLVRSDRVGMSKSIELRIPYLTRDMVKLALNIPFNRKAPFMPSYHRRRLFVDKKPLRQIAKNLGIDQKIVNRAKIGTPTGEIDEKNLFYITSIFSLKNVATLFDIKEEVIKNYLNNIKFYPMRYRLFWTFISFEIIIRMFINKNSPNEIEAEFRHILKGK